MGTRVGSGIRGVLARRLREAPVQGELDLVPRTWGGRRVGAGHRRDPKRHDPPHRARPAHVARYPHHIVMRTRPEVGRLRRGPIYRAVRAALVRVGEREGIRIVHLSIQHNHLHLLVEASSSSALSRGMQALSIRAARAINKSLGRKGRVFAHRYHRTDITSPRQARNALAYVLNNWRRHREDQSSAAAGAARLDPYSTARAFDGWRPAGHALSTTSAVLSPGGAPPPSIEPLPSAEPRTWLLRVGWRIHGHLDPFAVPGPSQH